mgnify:CR=1 FL=1
MLPFFEKHKKKIVIALAMVLICCAVLTAGRKKSAIFLESVVGFVISPFQDLTTGLSSWMDDTVTTFTQTTEQADRIQELETQVAILEAENKRLALYEEENKTLSDLLDLAQRYPQHPTTGAKVIAKDPGNWYDIFTINKGTTQDISANQVVLAPGGLVGKVIESGATYSKVMSILDSRSSVSAMSTRTGDLGVVKGDYSLMNEGLCIMEYIDAEAEIMVGDEIVTSNLSETYPDGIPIGKVQEIRTDSNGLTKYAIIEPYCDLKHLTEVLLIDKSEVAQ